MVWPSLVTSLVIPYFPVTVLSLSSSWSITVKGNPVLSIFRYIYYSVLFLMLNLNLSSNKFYSFFLILSPRRTKICLLPFCHDSPLVHKALCFLILRTLIHEDTCLSNSRASRNRASLKGSAALGVGYDIILIRENVVAGPLCCGAFVKH